MRVLSVPLKDPKNNFRDFQSAVQTPSRNRQDAPIAMFYLRCTLTGVAKDLASTLGFLIIREDTSKELANICKASPTHFKGCFRYLRCVVLYLQSCSRHFQGKLNDFSDSFEVP